ncbi:MULTISPECIES: ABC transporter permease [Bacillaceae]|uniref:ABC transporter permease n=1 Tax=Bacillaceae TaxID=186817 RepID=UPI0006FFBD7D|nr:MULTISPECIES: ABC transporter permease [Bacillaceae]KQL34663.1 ABC transporter permease [Psychrobacillus sp. FJAT-21963]MDF2067418.1 ABC transporter permease [Bacillus sp. Cr_A10]
MRTIALIKRICIQMVRDKRTLALMMIAPLVILTLLHYLLSADTTVPRLGVHGAEEALIEQLKGKEIVVIPYENLKNTEQVIKKDQLDGVLQIEEDKLSLTLTNDEPSTSKVLQSKVMQAISSENAKKQATNLTKVFADIQDKLPNVQVNQLSTPEINTYYIYGNSETTFFDQLSPILVGFFVFFFVFLISGIGLLRERTTGTLERLLATPIQRRDIVFGYLIGYGLFAIIQTLIVVFYAVKVLDILIVGSLWNVVLINLSLALVALLLGILLSAFANSEFQMMQFIPIAIVPQVFFAGILPIEGMAEWMQIIAKFMPMYYGGNALVDVMYKGFGIDSIKNELFILLGFALIFVILNILALKKYRKI